MLSYLVDSISINVDSILSYAVYTISLFLLYFNSLVFIEEPVSVNASLNSTATFICKCHYCIGQFWEVNGQSANFDVNQKKGVDPGGPYYLANGDKLYNVSMPASIQLHNSTIKCIIYNGSSFKDSEVVYLKVQGNEIVIINLLEI